MISSQSPYQIAIRKITLDNFRGFEHLEILFHRDQTIKEIPIKHSEIDASEIETITHNSGLTVLIGSNGAGKSSILDAIAEFLKYFVDTIIIQREFRTSLSPLDVKNGTFASLCNIYLDVAFQEPPEEEVNDSEEDNTDNEDKAIIDDNFSESNTSTDIDDWYEEEGTIHLRFNYNKGKDTNAFSAPFDSESATNFSQLGDQQVAIIYSDDIRNSFDQAYRLGILTQVPVIVYYGCNSVNISSDLDIAEDHLSIFDVYKEALDPDNFSFAAFFQWFSKYYKIKLQEEYVEQAKQLNDDEIINKYANDLNLLTEEDRIRAIKNFDIVSKAIEDILNDEDEEVQFKNLRILWEEDGDKMLIDKGDETLNILQLSSGEKAFLGLVADLARRLCIANAYADNPLHGNGIVLIDEIDLHLHPKWQRKVLPQLRKIFPNVQFIVTTHSPLVLQNASGKILVLEKQKVSTDMEKLGGWEIKDIMKSMGIEHNELYSKEYKTAMHHFLDAYGEDDYDKAKKYYDELMKMLKENSIMRKSLKIKLDSI